MSQTIDAAIKEIVDNCTTKQEFTREIKMFALSLNEQKNIQMARIYGKFKYCLQAVIKLAMLGASMPKVEYYFKGYGKKLGTLEG